MNDIFAAVLTAARANPPRAAAATVAVVGALGICGFFFFQYALGYPPCPLCLEQRTAFYVCVPLSALLWLGVDYGASRKVLLLGFVVIAGFMLWNSGLAVYHAGIEWKFWPGPQDCTGPIDKIGSVGNLLKNLQSISLVRCDEAAWRFLGISLAGWNVPLSFGLASTAAWGAKASYDLREPE
jgi:disulfide bond formation protein DsbB